MCCSTSCVLRYWTRLLLWARLCAYGKGGQNLAAMQADPIWPALVLPQYSPNEYGQIFLIY